MEIQSITERNNIVTERKQCTERGGKGERVRETSQREYSRERERQTDRQTETETLRDRDEETSRTRERLTERTITERTQ